MYAFIKTFKIDILHWKCILYLFIEFAFYQESVEPVELFWLLSVNKQQKQLKFKLSIWSTRKIYFTQK